MSTTPTTWRDLADQLTPDQIAEIEHCERERDHGVWCRSYTVWERQAAGSLVQVVGYQYGDDRPVERVIIHEDTDKTDELTPARARVLACLLQEAAELVDKLAGGAR